MKLSTSNREQSILLLLIAVMSIAQLYSHGTKLLWTDDSYHYIAASQSFKKDFTLLDEHGHYFLFWPPLYPILLSIIGFDSVEWIVANIIISICIALIINTITKFVFKSNLFRWLCIVNILLGVHLLLITTFLWSELVFVLLVLVFISQVDKSMVSKKAIYLAVLSGCLMCLQRNAGFFIVGAASLWFAFYEKEWRQKFIKSFGFFFATGLIPMIWNIYIWFIVPHPHFTFSDRFFTQTPKNISSVVNGLVNAYLPIYFFHTPFVVILLLFFILVLFFLQICTKSGKANLISLLSIVSLVYLITLTLVLVINIAAFPVDIGEAERFLSVIIPLVSILLFKGLEIVHDKLKPNWKKILLVLVLCWMVYPLSRTINNAILWHNTTSSKP